jgi:flagellar hook-associated protein 3 FlgL
MEAATQVASTGIRVLHPWDDPAAAGQITIHMNAQAQATAIASATGRASDELASADTALESVGNAIAQAQQLAMQLSNSTYSASQRASGAVQLQGFVGQILAALNTQVGNRYIFGGTSDATPPFDSSGAYTGDGNVRKVEIAPGMLQDASVRADVAIKGAGGGVDVLSVLQSLQSALASNDVAGVQSSLDGLTSGIKQVAAARASAGAAMSTMDAAGAVAKSVSTTEQVSTSHLQDADIVDAATKLQLAQRALQAALSAASQSFQLSLLGQK